MKILLDMDGVMFDFHAGIIDAHGDKLDVEGMKAVNGDEAWDVAKHFDGTPEEFWAPLGYKFWRDLPLTEEARCIFRRCEALVGRKDICFLTSPCRTVGCMEGKRDSAFEHFAGVPILFSVEANGVEDHSPPKSFVAGDNSILIDDNSRNIEKWVENGGLGFLFPRRWNRHWEHEEWGVRNLSDFLRAVATVELRRRPPFQSRHAVQASP